MKQHSQVNILKVVDVVKADLEFPNNRGNPFSPLQQVSHVVFVNLEPTE